MKNIEFVRPEEIEKKSFEIITRELAEQGITLPKEQELITKRAIHTSADFDYTRTLTYSENAVEIALKLIREVAKEAKERGVTRATVSMEKALAIDKPIIFAIGNAPTALISLYEQMQSGGRKPDFLIGVPVGFVNVEAAKELFIDTDVPYIINRGRKGGSNIAAAICNALLYMARDSQP